MGRGSIAAREAGLGTARRPAPPQRGSRLIGRTRSAAALAATLLLAGCLSPAAPRDARRTEVERVLARAPVLVVYEPGTALAVATVEGSLTLSSGFDEGRALRERLALPPPARGFAEAFAGTLREKPRFAETAFRVEALPDLGGELAARGAEPVIYAHAAQWRLVYDLSLVRHRLVLELWVTLSPAAEVAEGRGGMALPQRIWRGACTWRGPDPTFPLEAWTANDGAVLRARIEEAQQLCGERVAERFVAFLERGEEQSPRDGGEL